MADGPARHTDLDPLDDEVGLLRLVWGAAALGVLVL